jgi:hypothetical protein
MPIKNSAGAAVAGCGEPPYDGGMEHRMTALETRLDTILPTLATKTDVEALRSDLRAELAQASLKADAKFAEMRADMRKMNADIKTWTLATMITIVGTMLAAIFGISQIYKSSAIATAPVIITIPAAFAPGAPTSPSSPK